jgi:DNA-directed RNA polymerase subunit RPC12/RpoP
MENTEYKCLCCGSIGSEEEFGINPESEFTGSTDFIVCPHCGNMEIDILVPEVDFLV